MGAARQEAMNRAARGLGQGRAAPQSGRASPAVLSAVLVLLTLMTTAVGSLGAPLLVSIMEVEHVSVAASQWSLTIALLIGAVATPVMGRLGDGRHRRAVVLLGVAATTLGCVIAAVPAGFAVLLFGRALQGVGFGLVPLATALARDGLPPAQSRRTVMALGCTTAAGVGIGYPVAGTIAQFFGLYAAFWTGAGVSAATLVAAALVLPASPERDAHVNIPRATVLGLALGALLLVLADGPDWDWRSPVTMVLAATAVALLAAWTVFELRAADPLIALRLLRHRPVLAANVTGLLVSIGFYPLMSLVVRLVQAPAATGYGFGASVAIAGLMLTPSSLASFAAGQAARRLAKRVSPDWAIATSCVVLIAALLLFLLARGTYGGLVVVMILQGLGIGCVFAFNPAQIVAGAP
ncbi:MAG TPA: MFS transporter, partial [Stellaceae bacterium]|nr:MFS transporter [Stellaceae bacterium]